MEMDVRKYLYAWTFTDDFIKKIESFHVWSNDPHSKICVMNGLFITKDNEVYAIGDLINRCFKESGQQSANYVDTRGLYSPVLLRALSYKRIKKLTITFNHVFMCTEEGEVWGYGRYKSKDVGFNLPNRVLQLSDKYVVDIAVGLYENSLLVLNDKGELFHWILMQSRAQVTELILTAYESKPISLFSGSELSPFFILLESGKVMKANRQRQNLMHFQNASDAITCKIVKISCGLQHALLLSEDGRLFVTGNNEEGQLGIGRKKDRADKLEQNSFTTEKIVDIAAAPACTLSAVMTETGKIYMFGTCRGVTKFKPVLTSCNSLQDVFFHYSVPLITYKLLKATEFPTLVHEPIEPIEHTNEIKPTDCLGQITNGPNSLNDRSGSSLPDSAISVEEFCDFKIVIDGKTIPVHKMVLALRSEHFAEMFQQNSSVETQSVLEIKEGNLKSYKAFLKYIYMDQIEDTSPAEIAELHCLANKYHMKTLAEHCSSLMEPTITFENVIPLYESTAVMNKNEKTKRMSEKLKELCVNFTVENEKAVIQSEGFKNMNSDMAKSLIMDVYERRS